MNDKMLTDRIKEVSKLCGDYPFGKNPTPYEYLWAIEMTIQGTNAACEDLHKLIQVLKDKLNMSNEDLFKMADEILILKTN